ncbi:hypothetical protein, partial [Streptococcus uberis]|uniref:hypothetical protein n=1 Tax=Streptococcus uberis TaxID=1349 RepID=UPI001EEF8274
VIVVSTSIEVTVPFICLTQEKDKTLVLLIVRATLKNQNSIITINLSDFKKLLNQVVNFTFF